MDSFQKGEWEETDRGNYNFPLDGLQGTSVRSTALRVCQNLGGIWIVQEALYPDHPDATLVELHARRQQFRDCRRIGLFMAQIQQQEAVKREQESETAVTSQKLLRRSATRPNVNRRNMSRNSGND